MLVSTTLILVVVTTIGFGTFIAKVQAYLVPATQEDEEEFHEMQRKNSAIIDGEVKKRRASSMWDHHENIVHPNEERDTKEVDEEDDPNAPFHWPKSRFVKWFTQFDEEKLKPFFIRRYDRVRAAIEDQYQELLKKKFEEDEDEDMMVDKVEAMQVVQSRNIRAVSDFNDRMRTYSAMGAGGITGLKGQRKSFGGG